MKTSATNRRLRVVLTAIKNGGLLPRPEFQRRLVWTNKHKQNFINTVLLEYPFPEIYIAAGTVNSETGEGTEMLVDGQQRMTTLLQYFTGSEDLRLGDIRPYASLTQAEKLRLLEYEVVVRDLGQKSIEEIKEVFQRINSTKYSLNAMEIHNARFDGAFKQFGEELSQNDFFEKYRVFKTNDVRRMGDLVFCLTLACTVLSTYFNRDDQLEGFLEKYNDDFPHRNELNGHFETIFNFIDSCAFEYESRVWKKADLFSLVIELYRALIRDKLKLVSSQSANVLNTFYQMVDSASSALNVPERVNKYYKASIQATNDRSSRIARGEVIAELIRTISNQPEMSV